MNHFMVLIAAHDHRATAHPKSASGKANKAEYRDCTRFTQGVQRRDVMTIKVKRPWTIAPTRRTVTPSSAITHNNTGAGG
jgi:hypothetical protein